VRQGRVHRGHHDARLSGGCGAWSPSTIYGNHQRGTGILNNELYVGRLVWNRLRYVKNPDTRKRVSRLNPTSEWMSKDVPELRIVPDGLWTAAKRAIRFAAVPGAAPWWRDRPGCLLRLLKRPKFRWLWAAQYFGCSAQVRRPAARFAARTLLIVTAHSSAS